MKKILVWLGVLLVLGAMISISVYAYKTYNNKKPEHESDKMLINDGEFMIALNKTNAESYLSNTAITSRLEVENFYKELKQKFIDKNEVFGEYLEFYISAVSNENMKMYLLGEFYFEGSIINSVKFSWYDKKLIFNNQHKNISFGLTERAYKGTSIACGTDSFIYVRNDDVDSKYVDVSKFDITSAAVQRLCNSIYSDLFYSLKAEKDTATEKKLVSINTEVVSGMIDGSFEYDTDAFPSTDLILKEWNRCYNADLYEDEGAQDVMKVLLFEYAYKNKSTLEEIKFYVLLSCDNTYGGIYVLKNKKYECIYYYTQSEGVLCKGTLEYDMTNYTFLSHYVEMDIYNTYFVKFMQTDSKGVLQFTDSTKLLLIGNVDLADQFLLFRI